MKPAPLSTCPHCGAALEAGSRFCSACGQSIGESPSAEPASAGPPDETITWEQDISLLNNPLIMKQLLLVVAGAGLLMAFLLSFVFAATGEFDAILPIIGVSALAAAGLGLFMFLVMVIFFGNRIRIRFTVDENGALWETIDKRALGANRLAMVAGVLGRSPTTAGAGAMAASREKEFVAWTEVAEVETNPGRFMIILRNSWRPVMMLACRPDTFGPVKAFLEQRITPGQGETAKLVKRKALAKPVATALLRTVAVSVASTPVLMLSRYPVELDIFLPLLMFGFALATVWLIPLFGWVVLGVGAILVVQITWVGLGEVRFMNAGELAVFILAYAGLLWLGWFSRGAVRGRFLPPLMEG